MHDRLTESIGETHDKPTGQSWRDSVQRGCIGATCHAATVIPSPV
jgi:hypothetical protein